MLVELAFQVINFEKNQCYIIQYYGFDKFFLCLILIFKEYICKYTHTNKHNVYKAKK